MSATAPSAAASKPSCVSGAWNEIICNPANALFYPQEYRTSPKSTNLSNEMEMASRRPKISVKDVLSFTSSEDDEPDDIDMDYDSVSISDDSDDEDTVQVPSLSKVAKEKRPSPTISDIKAKLARLVNHSAPPRICSLNGHQITRYTS